MVWQVIKGDYATEDTEWWPNTTHKQTQAQEILKLFDYLCLFLKEPLL